MQKGAFGKAPDCSVAGDFHLAACTMLCCNDFVLVMQVSFCINMYCLLLIRCFYLVIYSSMYGIFKFPY